MFDRQKGGCSFLQVSRIILGVLGEACEGAERIAQLRGAWVVGSGASSSTPPMTVGAHCFTCKSLSI